MKLSEVFFCSNKILHRNGTVECVNAGLYEPRHEKTGFFHMRKQRRRSALL